MTSSGKAHHRLRKFFQTSKARRVSSGFITSMKPYLVAALAAHSDSKVAVVDFVCDEFADSRAFNFSLHLYYHPSLNPCEKTSECQAFHHLLQGYNKVG